MLWTLEREMAGRGAQTTVAASSGSKVAGTLFSTGEPCTQPDDFERRNLEHQEKILELIRREKPFDLIHDKSGSFWPRAAEAAIPVLATLHLPRHFYHPEYFARIPANVSFNCVSQSQARSFSDLPRLLGVVPNGIVLAGFATGFATNDGSRNGLLWLGRICEEKGTHLALDIAAAAGMPVTIAGQVYPFTYHQQYFEREIATRLGRMPDARFISTPTWEEKRNLLGAAKAVLITSLVDETSSLVAMEAAASGTPVVAFRRGALPEVIEDGVTGFLVDGVEQAVAALADIERIRPQACVEHARRAFASTAMADRYSEIYAGLLKR